MESGEKVGEVWGNFFFFLDPKIFTHLLQNFPPIFIGTNGRISTPGRARLQEFLHG